MRFLAALLVLLASAASGEELTIAWTAAEGRVADYVLESSTNGGAFAEVARSGSTTPQAIYTAVDGDVEQFRVYAVDRDGRAGPRSINSDPYVVGEDRGPLVMTAPGRPIVILPAP